MRASCPGSSRTCWRTSFQAMATACMAFIRCQALFQVLHIYACMVLYTLAIVLAYIQYIYILHQCPSAAITKCHKLSGSQQLTFMSHHSGGKSPKLSAEPLLRHRGGSVLCPPDALGGALCCGCGAGQSASPCLARFRLAFVVAPPPAPPASLQPDTDSGPTCIFWGVFHLRSLTSSLCPVRSQTHRRMEGGVFGAIILSDTCICVLKMKTDIDICIYFPNSTIICSLIIGIILALHK